MSYDLPNDFFDLLFNKFEEAKSLGVLKFNGDAVENEISTEKINDFTFDIQYSLISTLLNRPGKGTQKFNPFENPEPELTIVEDFGDENQFRIVYNKFPVVPRHIMLLTKAFKSQTTPLSPDELTGTYAILKKLAEDKNDKWFAFYNCGEESGASQPHKHIQFMTLPKGFSSYCEKIALKSEAFIPDTKREPLQDGNLPFAHYIARLPNNIEELESDDLIMYFSSLLQRALTTLRDNEVPHISYNVIMTLEYMMIVPRSNGTFNGLGVNSCGMVGLFLFKSREILDMIKNAGLEKVFEHCCLPSSAGQGSDEYHY